MSKKIKIVCFHGDKKVDAFMHSADVFESFKALSIPNAYELTVKDEATLEKVVEGFRLGIENVGDRVTACFVPEVAEGAWVDESVKLISDGHKFGRMDEALKAFGYVGKTEELKSSIMKG